MAGALYPCPAPVQMAALFMDRHHGAFRRDPRNLPAHDRAALIQDRIEPDSLLPEVLRRQNHTVSAGFFIIGRADVQIHAREIISLRQQLLRCLKLGKEGRFGIDGSPAVEEVPLQLRPERIGLPPVAAVHHIMVGHEHHVFHRIPAPEDIDKAAASEGQPFRFPGKEGKVSFQHLIKPVKFCLIGSLRRKHRPAGNHIGKGLRIGPVGFGRNVFPLALRAQGSFFTIHAALPPFGGRPGTPLRIFHHTGRKTPQTAG